ncbi:MAG: TRAP transporter substrate-binding protein DctP [Desulfobacterales bacterium]|nr:TRAP transporter substrate-binding protein DctP [Desulfobacterales bacterium]
MKKRAVLSAILVCLVSVAFLCTTADARPVTLKVSHQFAKGDVRDEMTRIFGDKVTEMTNGEVKFRYYPASALFKAKEQWDAMRMGSLDMSLFPLDYAGGKVPQFSVTLMPCTVQNVAQGLTWRNKPIGKKLEAMMLENGVRNLAWAWFSGGFGSNVRQIKLPEDVKGQKMRAAGKKFEYMLREAGASITSMPSSEAYQALATGVLDGLMTSAASFVSYRLYEQLKYANVPTKYSIFYMAENLCISEKTWQRLTADQQKAFLEVAEWMHKDWIEDNFNALAKNMYEEYKKAGAEVHEMTKEEFAAWQEFAKKTSWKDYADNVEGGQELLDLAVDAME